MRKHWFLGVVLLVVVAIPALVLGGPPGESEIREKEIYGGSFAPCDPASGSPACQWSEDHQTHVVWMGCYETPYGLGQKVGTSGVMGGGIPCSYDPPSGEVPWCPQGMVESINQWGGRGCSAE